MSNLLPPHVAGEIARAEQRGYSRGYRTGRRRRQRDVSAEQRAAKREAFIERAFLAILATAYAPGYNWGVTKDGKHVTFDADERIDFAWRQAVAAWARRRMY